MAALAELVVGVKRQVEFGPMTSISTSAVARNSATFRRASAMESG
jgi:hypothetical protein